MSIMLSAARRVRGFIWVAIGSASRCTTDFKGFCMASIAASFPPRPRLALRYHIGKYFKYRYLPLYFWYHKVVFRIDNTKFDISFCVFLESFINDQYGIREFIDKMKSSDELTFVDLGRNHGFVFYYMMYYLMKKDFPVKKINYYGIDPSPLKFTYFNFHDYLKRNGITVDYNIIDRAVVFDNERHVRLQYGEKNFGNFHVSGSNYVSRSDAPSSRFEFIEICVETMQFDEVRKIITDNAGSDTLIVKIDCKNRTDYMFAEILDMLADAPIDYLLAAEQDGSSDRDLSGYLATSEYVRKFAKVLRTWRIAGFPKSH
jgi:hypothetical protein